MNQEQLQELWGSTLGHVNPGHLDPSVTYRSPAWVRIQKQSTSSLDLVRSSEHTLDDEDLDKTVMVLQSLDIEDDYILSDRIARGGMGLIYRAHQTTLKREIALKKAHPQPGIQDRFVFEALVTANLDHPNIVPVYDLIEIQDGIALAMKLIGGVSWKALLHPSTPEEHKHAEEYDFERHIEILLKVCDAVAYAHSKGLTHNDLKPENVMVGEFGEVFVMDWGLTLDFRDIQTPPVLAPHCKSINGEVFGTPSYMAPELAEGQGESIGPWTDVYLLGAILYELIMGQPPHQGTTIMEVLLCASQSSTPIFRHNTPKNLRDICEKSMSRHPYQRYRDVPSFRDAVRAYLKHRESMLITEKAQAQLRTCQKAVGHLFAAYDKTQSHTRIVHSLRGDRNQLYMDISESVAGFVQAQVLWQNNPEAKEGENQARIVFARVALQHGDLGLAEAQASSLDPSQGEVADLFTDIEVARHERIHARRNARVQRRLLVLGGFVFALGLILAVILLNSERKKANKNARLAQKRLNELHRLADTKRLRDYQQEAQFLWPAAPHKIKQMERWLEKAKQLANERKNHIRSLKQLRTSGMKFKGGWRFKNRAIQWQHDNLQALIKQIGTFQRDTLHHVQMRLKQARTLRVRSTVQHQKKWAHAITDIADRKRNPHYKGLHIQPQIGLVPLGQNPRSKLWEFAHLPSGHMPVRKTNGNYRLKPQTGVILVLIPGGTFQMGSTRSTNTLKTSEGSGTRLSENPPHNVQLSAFFLSKYELTQGQWMRFSQNSNPSEWTAGRTMAQRSYTALHPVENIRWQDATHILSRMGLMLPTEAQWEYAARAGTTTPWSTGRQKVSLRGFVNLADRTWQAFKKLKRSEVELWLRDGYIAHAPIGSFKPNAWGLFDMHGNVWEWCFDRRGAYTIPVGPQNGLRMVPSAAARIIRGGSFRTLATHSRTTARQARNPSEYTRDDLGLRPALSIR